MPDKPESPHQKWAPDVDRLLRQLRRTAPAPTPPSPTTPPSGITPPPRSVGPRTAGAARPAVLPRRPATRGATAPAGMTRGRRALASVPSRVATLPSPLGVWARVALVVGLLAAMTQWPYRVCGLPLAGYLVGVAVVLVAGAWAAHAAWRRRMGRAHVIALVLLVAGLGLGALQVLPRFGYAPVETTWRCTP